MTKRIQTVWVCNPAARRVIALGLTKASWRERLGAIDVRLIRGETRTEGTNPRLPGFCHRIRARKPPSEPGGCVVFQTIDKFL